MIVISCQLAASARQPGRHGAAQSRGRPGNIADALGSDGAERNSAATLAGRRRITSFSRERTIENRDRPRAGSGPGRRSAEIHQRIRISSDQDFFAAASMHFIWSAVGVASGMQAFSLSASSSVLALADRIPWA